MNPKLLSLVVIFTQSIQLSNIVCGAIYLSFRLVFYGHYEPWGSLANMRKVQDPPPRRILNLEQVSVEVPKFLREMVELNGIEPLTPCLQSRCSPN